MRPHKLYMKAFGPFAKETSVDFDAMGSNIYLIYGPTGSGKTTIFDGIVYALYGTASGGGRSGMGTEKFQSDYAREGKHRDPMEVRFTFSNAGKTYTIERGISWGKTGEKQTADKTAVLFAEGEETVYGRGQENRDAVTKKVESILGLNAKQFCQIVMLAQGEFQKFLSAGSDARGEILGRLYNNSQHKDIQARLKAAASLLQKKEEDLARSAKAQLEIFVFPEDASEEEKMAVTVNHPKLIEAAGQLFERLEEAAEKNEAELNTKKAEKEKFQEERTQGEGINQNLDALDTEKKKLAELEGKGPEMDDLQKRAAGAAAAEKVLPLRETAAAAEREYEALTEQIGEMEKNQKELAEKSEELKKAQLKTEETDTPKIRELSEKRSGLQHILPVYRELAESENAERTAREALKKAEDAENAAEENLKKLRERQKKLSEQLKELEDAGDAAVMVAEKKKKELQDRKKDLDNLKKDAGKVIKLEQESLRLEESWKNAKADAEKADGMYMLLNGAFILGQAGLLADHMRKRLKTEREVYCPVCGSVHTAENTERFASLHEDTPTETDVNDALKALNEAKQAEADAKTVFNQKDTEYKTRLETVLEKAEKLIGVSGREAFSDISVLTDAEKQCASDLEKAQKDYSTAVSRNEAKKEALEDQKKLEEDLNLAEADMNSAKNMKTDAVASQSAASSTLADKKNRLQGYPENEKAAEIIIKDCQKREEKLQEELENAKKAVEDCGKALSANHGRLETARIEIKKRLTERDKAESNYAEILEKQNFADEAALLAACSPEGSILDSEQLEKWILKKQSELTEYTDRCKAAKIRILQLTGLTAGKLRTDLQAYDIRIGQLSKEISELEDRKSSLSAWVSTDGNVIGKLKEIRKLQRKYDRVTEMLKPLSDTANGSLNFSRYVLGDYFRRIIDRANIHLNTMTDGEYALETSEDGDKRGALGLGLKVRNMVTGAERETASLSGGQSFEASLSLALGLSEIAQMESASTVQIDSMFIDEGFGSLDGARLDKALRVLNDISDNRRQIGIISHVARLEECIDNKIHVIPGPKGSTVKTETKV